MTTRVTSCGTPKAIKLIIASDRWKPLGLRYHQNKCFPILLTNNFNELKCQSVSEMTKFNCKSMATTTVNLLDDSSLPDWAMALILVFVLLIISSITFAIYLLIISKPQLLLVSQKLSFICHQANQKPKCLSSKSTKRQNRFT